MNVYRIVVHHSATVDGVTYSWSAIRKYHINDMKWLDIGYHGGAEYVGDEPECMFGRPDTMIGAHVAGSNTGSLGFCFVGNYDLIEPPLDLLRTAARRVLAPWLTRYGLDVRALVPHREYNSGKSCPGTKFDMDVLRREVGRFL